VDAIKISDTGTNLLITGPDRGAVQAALDGMIARGSSVVSPPAQIGQKWLASCSKPLAQDASGGQESGRESDQFDDVIRDALWKQVRVEEAGAKMIVTGKEKALVEKALQLLAAQGSGAATPVAPFGNGWIGSCENPKAEAEVSVERLGHQVILSGPSEAAVRDKLRELQVGGAKALGEVEKIGDKFMVVCDYRS
jgi:hypothetical protein